MKGYVVKNWGIEFSPKGFNDNRIMHLFIFARRALTFNALKIQILVYSLREKEFMYVVSIVINLLPEKYVTILLA